MRDVILSFLRNQSHFTCLTLYLFNKANSESDVYPWQPNISNHAKLKQKVFIYIPKTIGKSKFKVCMLRYFRVITRSTQNFYSYNVQF